MGRAVRVEAASAADAPRGGWSDLGLPAAIVAAGLFAYWGSWNGGFVFDDTGAIVDNVPLQAGDWWEAAFGEKHQPLANRPLACLSLVGDLALHGPGPFGPRLTNVVLHLLNALLLFFAARSALSAPNLAARFAGSRGPRLAAAMAMVWVVHPLGVEAVGYATQRSTLLFSGFLLAALWASLAGHGSPHGWRWRSLAWFCLACGMASKEDMVLAPLLLVLCERAFVFPSWSAMRPRLPWYCVLALSWVVLAACVALGPENLTVGYATRSPVTAAEWLMTQAGVLVHYLRLCVVPYPLRTVYDWPIVRDVGGALLPGVVVLALLGATLSFWPRRPWWGWLGALFFLLLAPTSSVMPIITEVVAERRVYLPMLAVLVPLVFAADRAARDAALRGARGVGPFVLVAAVLGLCFVTRDRVLVYRDEASFWADASGKRDPQSRSFLSAIILANQGLVLAKQGRAEEANACFDTAVQCATPPDQAVTMYALSLLRRKRHAEAVDVMRQLVATDPTDNAWGVLGVCLTVAHEAERGGRDDPRLAEAEALLRRRLVGSPRDLQCWNALGYVLRVTGRLAAAEDAYRHVTELSLDEVPSYFLRAQLLMGLGRGAEIGPLFDRLLAGRPRDVALRMNLAEMAQRNQDPGTAITMLEQVLAIEPGHAQAAASLQELKARLGR